MFFLFVDRDIADLLDDLTPFHGRHVHKSGDITLQDDVISIRIDPGRRQKIQYFCPGLFLPIDPIGAAAILIDSPIDHYFLSIYRKCLMLVVKGNFHVGGSSWFFVLAAVKYEIRSLL